MDGADNTPNGSGCMHTGPCVCVDAYQLLGLLVQGDLLVCVSQVKGSECLTTC